MGKKNLKPSFSPVFCFNSMKNVTLVAFYGEKPALLIDLIQQLQASLNNHELIQDKFIPYQLKQVHGTIIGCEGTKTELGVVNQWFGDRRQETRYIDFPGLVNYLQHQIDLPLTIRFGGYDRLTNYNFLSRHEHLYNRSWQLQSAENQIIPVLIGWSWSTIDCEKLSNNGVSLAIDDLRRSFQQFNLLHKYHQTAKAIDNDFYLRLGTIKGKLTPEAIQAIAIDIRNLLANQPPLYIPIKKENIAFAQYQDLSLTPAKTKVIPISEITFNELEQMY
jgi:hypothetical protein